MEKSEIRCIVSGKVQGVTYRDYIWKKARSLALVGFVRNLPDHKVEIVVQGYPDALERFLEHARRGPFLARVAHIEIERGEPSATFSSFEVVF